MDFAFTDEQDELREGVRTVLDTECTPDALRAFELADEAGRAEQSQNRWAVLAELGAPALVVPEAADGLGLSDVDLVGVLEEAGRAGLPEPLLETAALAAPTLAALLPDAAAAAALAALVRDDVSFAVGGIDVTPGGRGLARPRCPPTGRCARPAWSAPATPALLLLAVPRRRLGLAAARRARRVLHGRARRRRSSASRDLSTVHWPLASDTLLAYGVAAEAAVGLLADRAAAGTAALLIGLAERMLAMSGGLRQGAPPVRQAHRQLPGRQAPAGQRPGGARVRPARHLPRRLVAGHGAAHALPRRVHGQGHGLGRRRPGGPGGPAGARGHRLHVGVRPPLLLEARRGRCRGPGATPPRTAGSCWPNAPGR